MRIYEGSPRTDWEEVLRSIGAHADHEQLKELLFLELDQGFILQGLGPPHTGAWAEGSGALVKRTYELVEDKVSELVDELAGHRGQRPPNEPAPEITHYYEHAMRVLGKWIDGQKARDVFLFEQEGSFVIRLLIATPGGTGHQLAEFTREEILAMIEAAPEERAAAPETPAGG